MALLLTHVSVLAEEHMWVGLLQIRGGPLSIAEYMQVSGRATSCSSSDDPELGHTWVSWGLLNPGFKCCSVLG
jgi:hypothetical protein